MTIKLLGESGIISDGQASRVKLRLRDIIRESHLRQTEIANRIGISARAWSRICNRGHAISHWMENRLMWQELASVLGVELEDMLIDHTIEYDQHGRIIRYHKDGSIKPYPIDERIEDYELSDARM